MRFHAHVYFDLETHASIKKLHATLLRAKLEGLEVGPLEIELRGPHVRPMFELQFGSTQFSEVVLWLMFNRGPHVVLVHAVTGSDPVDHDRHVLWLGAPLPLDVTQLDPPGKSVVPSFAIGRAAELNQ